MFARSARNPRPKGSPKGRPSPSRCSTTIKNVDVIGTSKGRGFTGVIKRHGFKGLRATHGVKRMHRHPGSSGPSADPARTRKGIKKPGQHGNTRVTVKNLKVVRVDHETTCSCSEGRSPGLTAAT